METPLAELKATPQYKLLTTPQRDWLDAYVESGGDGEAATKRAFSTNTDGSLKVQTRRMLDHPIVSQLIAVWTGAQLEPTLEEYRRMMWEIGSTTNVPAAARVTALVAYGKLRWPNNGGAGDSSDDLAKQLAELDVS